MSQNEPCEVPLLTFNSLYNLLREEKREKKLQKLPELFYEALEKFLSDKKEEISRLKKDSPDQEKMRKEQHILKNSRKIAKELLNLRCVKISNIAIKNKVFEEDILSIDNVLEKEKGFLDIVQKGIKTIIKSI